MPDYNKEALEIWNSLKPMIDKEITAKTQGMVQRRKATVTTAPSLSTNTIGVTEPFGQELMLPFATNLITANVGDSVWYEFSYGATNAVVVSFASSDDKDFSVSGFFDVKSRRSEGTLSSPGWYRVLEYDAQKEDGAYGAEGAVIGITITTNDVESLDGDDDWRNGVHKIDFLSVWGGNYFCNETANVQEKQVDKIRYSQNLTENKGYIDIHFRRSYEVNVTVCFDIKASAETSKTIKSAQMLPVADSPVGENVYEEYSFSPIGSSLFDRNGNSKIPCNTLFYGNVQHWNSGNLTVNSISKYSLIQIELVDKNTQDKQPACVLAMFDDAESPGYLCGKGGYPASASSYVDYYFEATVSGDTLTFQTCYSLTDGTTLAEMEVERIIGII